MESPFTSRGVNAGGSSLPPPTYVRYLPQGEISDAWISQEPPRSGKPVRPSPSQKAGIAFERRVGEWAGAGGFAGDILRSPWLAFVDGGRARHWCQPDLVFDDGVSLVVVEAKLRFSADAWWQLKRLYTPVLQKIFPLRDPIISLCVCKSFDPTVVSPEPPVIREDLFDCQPGSFNVLLLP